jgi:tetratricopeptide (TPR) repeat protein
LIFNTAKAKSKPANASFSILSAKSEEDTPRYYGTCRRSSVRYELWRMRQLRREPSQASSLIIQQFREGMTVEQRVAIINKESKAMMSTGNYFGAIECCNEAIALNNSSLAVINRAYCYKHLKNWKLSIEDFTLALLQDPSHPAPILAQRGICYGKLELYEQSLSDLNAAIEVKHLNPPSLMFVP